MAENSKSDEKPTNSQIVSLFPTTEKLDDEIHWEEWESAPFKVKSEIIMENKKTDRGTYIVNGVYPIITGFQNHKTEQQVNQWIKESLHKEIKTRSFEWINHYSFDFSYKIMLLNESFVSILYEYYFNIGGSHGYNSSNSINIDLIKEKKLEDNELFYPNSNFWDTLKPSFKKDFEKQYRNEIHLNDVLLEYSIIHPDLSFSFTPDNLVITYNQNETDASFSSRVHVFIPLSSIVKITPYKGFNKAYSYFSSPKGWEVLENKNDSNHDLNQGYIIKFPAIKDKDGKILNLHKINFHDVVIDIPVPEEDKPHHTTDDLQGFDTVRPSIQVQWRDIDGSLFFTDKIKLQNSMQNGKNDKKNGYWEQEQINGIWFEKCRDNEICYYRGLVKGTEYLITITIPQNDTDVFITHINQILGTFRFY